MTYPLVLDLAADGVPVAVTCRVLGFSRKRSTPGRPVRSAGASSTTPTSPTLRWASTATTRSSATASSPTNSEVLAVKRESGESGGSAPKRASSPPTAAFAADAPNQLWLTPTRMISLFGGVRTVRNVDRPSMIEATQARLAIDGVPSVSDAVARSRPRPRHAGRTAQGGVGRAANGAVLRYVLAGGSLGGCASRSGSAVQYGLLPGI